MKRVAIESPFAGDIEGNLKYARSAMADSLKRGEAPIASHLLYTQDGILDDDIPGERQLGIEAGLSWNSQAELVAIYEDKGISSGMEYGILRAISMGIPIEYRTLKEEEK